MKQAVFIKKKKESFEICEEGHFETEKANLQWIKQNPKIHREKQKEKRAKRAREKQTLTLTISSAFSLFCRVMKTRVSQRLAKYFFCCAVQDVIKTKYANRNPG